VACLLQVYEPKDPLVRGVDIRWLQHVFLPYAEEHCWPTEGATACMSRPQSWNGQYQPMSSASLPLNSFPMLVDAFRMTTSPHASLDRLGGATNVDVLEYPNAGAKPACKLAMDTKAGQAWGKIGPGDRFGCTSAGCALSGHGPRHFAVSGRAGVVNAGGHVVHNAHRISPVAEARENASAASTDSNARATSSAAETPPTKVWQAKASTVALFTQALVKRHAYGCSYYSLVHPECGPSHSLGAYAIVSLQLACSIGRWSVHSQADITLEFTWKQGLW
jgi:hypothetical protein